MDSRVCRDQIVIDKNPKPGPPHQNDPRAARLSHIVLAGVPGEKFRKLPQVVAMSSARVRYAAEYARGTRPRPVRRDR